MIDTPILLIDIGNTRLKWGIARGGTIKQTGAILLESLHDSNFTVLTKRLPKNISDVMVCNVAGQSIATRLTGILGLHGDATVRFAHSERNSCGVTNGYRQPRRLGVDRWVALIGAHSEFSGSVCVVDAGTAMTIDALDKNGQHLGGQIVAGFELMASALTQNTSDISEKSTKFRDPGDGLGIFGKSTADAINFGSLTAACGAIDRSARRLRSAGLRPKIILTGGNASRILKQLTDKEIHRPNLILQGLLTMVTRDL